MTKILETELLFKKKVIFALVKQIIQILSVITKAIKNMKAPGASRDQVTTHSLINFKRLILFIDFLLIE